MYTNSDLPTNLYPEGNQDPEPAETESQQIDMSTPSTPTKSPLPSSHPGIDTKWSPSNFNWILCQLLYTACHEVKRIPVVPVTFPTGKDLQRKKYSSKRKYPGD